MASRERAWGGWWGVRRLQAKRSGDRKGVGQRVTEVRNAAPDTDAWSCSNVVALGPDLALRG